MNGSPNLPDGIAVIGMAGRFPKARNIEEFWQNLRNGVEAISFFSDEELEAAESLSQKDNPNYVKARAVLEDADKFDAGFFRNQQEGSGDHGSPASHFPGMRLGGAGKCRLCG